MLHAIRRVLLAVACVVLASPAFAQLDTGAIVGTVSDSSAPCCRA